MEQDPRHQSLFTRLAPLHGKTKVHKPLLQRFMPSWLMERPETVSKEEAKIYFVRLAVPLIGMGCHSALLGLYLFFHAPFMASVNGLSILTFAVAAVMVRLGRHRLGTGISVVEALIHAPAATVMLGVGSGYLLFNFIIAMCAALVYTPKERTQRNLVLIYAIVSSVLVTVYMRGRAPMIHLSSMQMMAIYNLIAATTYVALVCFALYFVGISERAEKRIERELARSEILLLNVLPAEIADRLKANPGTIADSFVSATVLFADIVGFTKLASVCPGHELVKLLNEVFSSFDRIAAKYGLEKIKTIGDAYMVVGGVPKATTDHAERVVRMALDLIASLPQRAVPGGGTLEIRVGVHSGPVVAGVIGERKFAYDLWGDTVNVASRMEAHGVAGHVQITAETRALLPPGFLTEERGLIEVKGKGEIRTWFVRSYTKASAGPAANGGSQPANHSAKKRAA